MQYRGGDAGTGAVRTRVLQGGGGLVVLATIGWALLGEQIQYGAADLTGRNGRGRGASLPS